MLMSLALARLAVASCCLCLLRRPLASASYNFPPGSKAHSIKLIRRVIL